MDTSLDFELSNLLEIWNSDVFGLATQGRFGLLPSCRPSTRRGDRDSNYIQLTYHAWQQAVQDGRPRTSAGRGREKLAADGRDKLKLLLLPLPMEPRHY